MKKLFQYTVILHEFTQGEKGKEYKDSKVIIEPKFILAKNEKDVAFKVTREIPDEFAVDPDNVEIVIRNF
jgi:hypothetical protein